MPPRDGDDVVRVLVVDDHEAIADALCLAIDTQSDLACVGIAMNVPDALSAVARHRPDVVLIHMGLPRIDGIEGTRRILAVYPQTAVLVLSGQPVPLDVARAADAGAAGFLRKAASFEQILGAIRDPTHAWAFLDVSTVDELSTRRSSTTSTPPDFGLTPREAEVLDLLGEGKDPGAIARELHLSVHTARGYVKSILSKLGAHTQLEAVVIAARNGVLKRFRR